MKDEAGQRNKKDDFVKRLPDHLTGMFQILYSYLRLQSADFCKFTNRIFAKHNTDLGCSLEFTIADETSDALTFNSI